MADTKPDDAVTIDVRDLRKVEEETEPKANPNPKSPLEDPGAAGGTSGTGGTTHDQDR